jgi:hypothetical protein
MIYVDIKVCCQVIAGCRICEKTDGKLSVCNE